MTPTSPSNSAEPLLPILTEPSSRRTALKAAGAALGLAAFGKAVSPLMVIPENVSVDEFLQQHYKELTDEDKTRVFARLEAETKEDYGADVTISDPRPIPGVKFGYAINLSKCNGNGACMEACNKENNHHRGVDQSYIRILEMTNGSMDMEQGTTTFDHTVPQDDKFYMPVQCQQCDDPPCVTVCPVEATWKEDDGSWQSTTTGASAVGIVKRPVRTTLGDSTGSNRRFPPNRSIRTRAIFPIEYDHRARWKNAITVCTGLGKVELQHVWKPAPRALEFSVT